MFQVLPRTVVASTALVVSLMFVGCATMERHPDIPVSAMMGSEGTSQLAYKAPGDGMTYVYDVSAEEIVYAGQIEADDLVVVDPSHNRVAVDGQTVAENSLREGNLHRIYFLQEGSVERRVEERVIRSEEMRVEESDD